MTRRVEFGDEEFYHVFNRGTEKRNVFTRKSDYERFVALLYACNREESVRLDGGSKLQGRTLLDYVLSQKSNQPLVDVCAYCVMPNHFHLLLRQRVDGGISKFMQKLITGYTMYFNKRNDRSGVLFQGKYKAVHADSDRYLKYLIAYIHLNPAKLIDSTWREKRTVSKLEMEAHLAGYQYSSYQDYLDGQRAESKILNKTSLPLYFESPADFKREMYEWIELREAL